MLSGARIALWRTRLKVSGDGILPAVVDPLPLGIAHRIRKGAAGFNGYQRPGYFRHALLTSSKDYDCSFFTGQRPIAPLLIARFKGMLPKM